MNGELKTSTLELCSTEELIQELGRRYHHAVFAGVKVLKTDGTSEHLRRWIGNTLVCVGLAANLAKCVNGAYEQTLEFYGDGI